MVTIFPEALRANHVTILGYGALLSEPSARLTFPNLSDFRLVRVKQFRRIFRHPHVVLIEEGVLKPQETLRIASLSAEPAENCSFVAAAFSVSLDDGQRAAFVAREPLYNITTASYFDLDTDVHLGEGVICAANMDDLLPEEARVHPGWGVDSVWSWGEDSGLLPADIYLRHCLLAVRKAGSVAEQSFLNDTTLIDRKTTLADYMKIEGGRVMASRPPSRLLPRFSG
jgi:hypothetical protein